MNKIITFKQKKIFKKILVEALLFAITVIIGLTVYNSVGILLEERLGFHYLIAAIGATLSNFMVQFLLSKFLVFSHYKVF
jgi:putative flippase GtrA